MDQMGFSELEFATKKRQTRRERFLDQIEAATPWALLLEQMEPFYPKARRGRPPIGLERMLRMYIVQQWYASGDPRVLGLQGRGRDFQIVRREPMRQQGLDALGVGHGRQGLEQVM